MKHLKQAERTFDEINDDVRLCHTALIQPESPFEASQDKEIFEKERLIVLIKNTQEGKVYSIAIQYRCDFNFGEIEVRLGDRAAHEEY